MARAVACRVVRSPDRCSRCAGGACRRRSGAGRGLGAVAGEPVVELEAGAGESRRGFMEPMTTLPSRAPRRSRSSRMSRWRGRRRPRRDRAVQSRSSRSARFAMASGSPPTARAPRAGWSAATIAEAAAGSEQGAPGAACGGLGDGLGVPGPQRVASAEMLMVTSGSYSSPSGGCGRAVSGRRGRGLGRASHAAGGRKQGRAGGGGGRGRGRQGAREAGGEGGRARGGSDGGGGGCRVRPSRGRRGRRARRRWASRRSRRAGRRRGRPRRWRTAWSAPVPSRRAGRGTASRRTRRRRRGR